MTVHITGKGALSQMANTIKQAEMATRFKMHEEAERRWDNAIVLLHSARKIAMEKNKLFKEIKDA